MKHFVVLFLGGLLCYHTAVCAAEPPAAGQVEADRLVKALPSLYWYASDACLRETSRAGAQKSKHDEFLRDHLVVIEKATSLEPGSKPRVNYEMSLSDPKEPYEHWVFEFVYDGEKWDAKSGYKFFGEKRTFDLYEGNIFLGSMKPYIQRGLDAFDQHKLFSDVFPPEGSNPARSATRIATANGTETPGTSVSPGWEAPHFDSP